MTPVGNKCDIKSVHTNFDRRPEAAQDFLQLPLPIDIIHDQYPMHESSLPALHSSALQANSRSDLSDHIRRPGAAQDSLQYPRPINATNDLNSTHEDLKASDKVILDYFNRAVSEPCCNSDKEVSLDPSLLYAIEFVACTKPSDLVAAREGIVRMIEQRAEELISNGEAAKWFIGCDPLIVKVCETVNGPLLQELAHASSFSDCSCVNFFRHGAPFIGKLDCIDESAGHELRASTLDNNRAVRKGLSSDNFASELSAQVEADVCLNRMTAPVPVPHDLSDIRLSPRFGVEQGLKADGSIKIRAIDDCTRSGINECCEPCRKLKVDGADALLASIRKFQSMTGISPELMKSDIDAAYRRVPIAPAHRWAAGIIFGSKHIPMMSQHVTMPFGSISAVHGWDRIGALLAHIARIILKIPVNRYVDDYFSAEYAETIQHAKECFARLVRALLGTTAVAERKLEHGNPLVILGLLAEVTVQGVVFRPSADKVEKWMGRIQCALESGVLAPGAASKLAGALNWTAQHAFHKLGRAMLIPLYCQARHTHTSVSKQLRLALCWWREALALNLQQTHLWAEAQQPWVHLFCDARGHPPHIAAVLAIDGKTFFCEMPAPPKVLEGFIRRADNQIMGLEMLSIALGLSSFQELLVGRRVVVWSDNTGAEAAAARGTAKQFDHGCLAHCLWLRAAQLGIEMYIKRVPTKDNIADLPSRGEFGLLKWMGASQKTAMLDSMFMHSASWESLSLRINLPVCCAGMLHLSISK